MRQKGSLTTVLCGRCRSAAGVWQGFGRSRCAVISECREIHSSKKIVVNSGFSAFSFPNLQRIGRGAKKKIIRLGL